MKFNLNSSLNQNLKRRRDYPTAFQINSDFDLKLRCLFRSMAAAGDDEKRDYKDPDPVIVEERAKAVVHKKPPLK